MTTATETKIRRDTASNIDAATPAEGELAGDLTNKRLRFGDGALQGGWHVPNHADIQNQAFKYATAGGSANALTLTLAPVPAAYTAGMEIAFKATANNTAAATINVNGLGAVSLKKNVGGTLTNPAANDLANGVVYKAIHDGTVFQFKADIAAGLTSVHQGDINTSTGAVSQASGSGGSTASGRFTLPGGSYGFYPQFQSNSNTAGAVYKVNFLSDNSSAGAIPLSYTTTMWLSNGGVAGVTLSAQQRYINASPPFHLGDSEDAPLAHGFIFALLDPAGDIVATYMADVPPWAYNGPTDIRARYRCPATGKKFRIVPQRRSLEEIMDGAKFTMAEPEEITQAIKNADRDLIPHPFNTIPDNHRVVLLDPTSDRMPGLIAHLNEGGGDEIIEALHSGKIYADNEAIKGLNAPPGVMIAPLRYRYSRL